MKNKFIIRILSIALCIAMLATGCGSKQEDSEKNAAARTTTAPVEEKTGDKEATSKTDGEKDTEPAKTTVALADDATSKDPTPTAELAQKASYFASVAENADRLVKEAKEQYEAGDYTPLSEPVKYNVLWLGFTHVIYGELDFQMTDFDREYLRAVTVNYEQSLEEITNHNLDITVDLHFVDDATPLTKTDNDDWLYLAQDTVQ